MSRLNPDTRNNRCILKAIRNNPFSNNRIRNNKPINNRQRCLYIKPRPMDGPVLPAAMSMIPTAVSAEAVEVNVRAVINNRRFNPLLWHLPRPLYNLHRSFLRLLPS